VFLKNLSARVVRSDGRLNAFTLLEMLVVLTIIGILLAVMMPNYAKFQEGAMKKAALSEMKGFSVAVYNYKMDNGSAPADVDDLVKGGYIPKEMAMDPWHHKYKLEYNPSTGSFRVISAGADGKFETKDDLVYESSF
jgi:general secretion pathway protein G